MPTRSACSASCTCASWRACSRQQHRSDGRLPLSRTCLLAWTVGQVQSNYMCEISSTEIHGRRRQSSLGLKMEEVNESNEPNLDPERTDGREDVGVAGVVDDTLCRKATENATMDMEIWSPHDHASHVPSSAKESMWESGSPRANHRRCMPRAARLIVGPSGRSRLDLLPPKLCQLPPAPN